MKDNSVFNAGFVIDGLAMDSTPAELLEECLEPGYGLPTEPADVPVIDETIDPTPLPLTFEIGKMAAYISRIGMSRGSFPVRYPIFGTRRQIAHALTETLWRKGSYKLGNLCLDLDWKWNSAGMGNLAAFYESARQASQYIFDLGLRMRRCSFKEADVCTLEVGIETRQRPQDELLEDGPHEISLQEGRICPPEVSPDPSSWIIYIPFDTCALRLGASALSAIAGNGSDTALDLSDPDYFMDCYEVVREMVEDGVVTSGVSVGRGGLVCAAASLCGKTGLSLDLSGISSDSGERSTARILFSEVPGALIQVRDADYDYIDSQFLLQDIAYYPVGHPSGRPGTIDIRQSSRPAVAGILESLIRSQETSEGED